MRKIQMMGIDHSRATVAERELFSLTKAKQKELMEAVIRQQGVGGCVLLSTCNRTELYVSLQKEEDIDLYRIFCHIREIPQTAQRWTTRPLRVRQPATVSTCCRKW